MNIATRGLLIALCCAQADRYPLAADPGAEQPSTRLAISGDRFLINGQPTDLYGIRVAGGSQDDASADSLVASLDDYVGHGVNAVTVFLQGSSGGFCDPFSPDGKTLDAGHADRLRRIVVECDRRGMIVIVGIFYQRTMKSPADRRLEDADAIERAVISTVELLRPYRNTIINIANEQNSHHYKSLPFFNFNDPEAVVKLCRIVRRENPDQLVGGGGYDDASNIAIGRSRDVDVLLFDTYPGDVDAGHDSDWHYEHFIKRGVVGKPIVNVEVFGGWTKACVSSEGVGGVFSDTQKKLYLREIEAAAERPGLSVFFHCNTWCQGVSVGRPNFFKLGGNGTPSSPGIRWWFEHVRAVRDGKDRD